MSLSKHHLRATAPDQASIIRLSRHQAPLLRQALQEAAAHARAQNDYDRHRRLKTILHGLPKSLPYDLSLYASEWPLISQALRPGDTHRSPTRGTQELRYRALYQYLLKHQGFRVK